MTRIPVVVIGRNEGDRLIRAMAALASAARDSPTVYVDSGSTDGSLDVARRAGVTVLSLDPSLPFTAGRGRNEGFAAALALVPDAEFVQFVDGDCELVSGWLERGANELRSRSRVAATCGRVRELHRSRTVYNRLCDIEWDAPPGVTRACGGNMMVRVIAFREAGGFRPGLIAGEEPDFCLRLRTSGWEIVRVDQEMVFHDAAMTCFAQWWRRSVRTGWSFAEGATIHSGSPERHKLREMRSAFFWGVALPVGVLALAWPTRGLSTLLLLGYPLLVARIYTRSRRRPLSSGDAWVLASFTVLGKLPQAIGQVQFFVRRAQGRSRRIIDWRSPS